MEGRNRKKFTTNLSDKTLSALDVIAHSEGFANKNDVIELLVRNYIKDNHLEELVNDKYKKNTK